MGDVMSLSGKSVAVLVEQQYQEMEVWYPVYRLREAGCKVVMVGPEAGKSYSSKLGYPATADAAAKEGCPVSKSLKVPITLDAKLES
jgi:protease I